MSNIEKLRKRHEFVMMQHYKEMRKRRVRFGLIMVFMIAVIICSIMVLVLPENFLGIQEIDLSHGVIMAIIIYTTAIAVLVIDLALTQRKLRQAIESSMNSIEVIFELGKQVGKMEGDRNAR